MPALESLAGRFDTLRTGMARSYMRFTQMADSN